MTPLQALDRQFEALAAVVDTDLQGALEFIEDLRDIFGTPHRDVVITRAVLELDNTVGYPVGHISFDGEVGLTKFTPHHDAKEES